MSRTLILIALPSGSQPSEETIAPRALGQPPPPIVRSIPPDKTGPGIGTHASPEMYTMIADRGPVWDRMVGL